MASNAVLAPRSRTGELIVASAAGCVSLMFGVAAPRTHHAPSICRTITVVVGPSDLPSTVVRIGTSPERASPCSNCPTIGSTKCRYSSENRGPPRRGCDNERRLPRSATPQSRARPPVAWWWSSTLYSLRRKTTSLLSSPTSSRSAMSTWRCSRTRRRWSQTPTARTPRWGASRWSCSECTSKRRSRVRADRPDNSLTLAACDLCPCGGTFVPYCLGMRERIRGLVNVSRERRPAEPVTSTMGRSDRMRLVPGVAIWRGAGIAARATPPDHDRVVDLLRSMSLAVVVLGHMLMAVVVWNHDEPRVANLLDAYPSLRIATWILQVMPLFFAAGAIANRRTWGLARKGGERWRVWTWGRLRRLLRPVVYYLAVWVPLVLVLEVTVPDAASRLAGLSTQLLWFLGVYVLVVATTPLQVGLAPRRPLVGGAPPLRRGTRGPHEIPCSGGGRLVELRARLGDGRHARSRRTRLALRPASTRFGRARSHLDERPPHSRRAVSTLDGRPPERSHLEHGAPHSRVGTACDRRDLDRRPRYGIRWSDGASTARSGTRCAPSAEWRCRCTCGTSPPLFS